MAEPEFAPDDFGAFSNFGVAVGLDVEVGLPFSVSVGRGAWTTSVGVGPGLITTDSGGSPRYK